MTYKDKREAVLIKKRIIELIKKHEGNKSMFIQMLASYIGLGKANKIIERLWEEWG